MGIEKNKLSVHLFPIFLFFLFLSTDLVLSVLVFCFSLFYVLELVWDAVTGFTGI